MNVSILAAAAVLLAQPAIGKVPSIHVKGWARATVPAQTAGAVYLDIHNAGPGTDRLLGVTTQAAARASVHTTSAAGGMARMRSVGILPIAAGKQLAMKPGGVHVMLTGLKGPLRPGQKLALSLRFERAGTLRTSIPIRAFVAGSTHDH